MHKAQAAVLSTAWHGMHQTNVSLCQSDSKMDWTSENLTFWAKYAELVLSYIFWAITGVSLVWRDVLFMRVTTSDQKCLSSLLTDSIFPNIFSIHFAKIPSTLPPVSTNSPAGLWPKIQLAPHCIVDAEFELIHPRALTEDSTWTFTLKSINEDFLTWIQWASLDPVCIIKLTHRSVHFPATQLVSNFHKLKHSLQNYLSCWF